MKLTIKQKIAGVLLFLVALLGGGVAENKLGGVAVGDQYLSTTTPTVADRTNLCPARVGMASSTTGLLGTVNIMSGGTGELLIIDATTTNVALRTDNRSTTTLVLAHYQTGAGTTSQVFDVAFTRGLLVDYTTGVASTSISYRCEN